MQVVRQNHPRIRMKWRRPANRTNGGAERFDFPHQQVRPAVCQIYSKEVRSSRNAIAAIVGHCGNVSTFLAWWNTLIHAGCGVGYGGWARWRCNQRWRKALRFSALRLLMALFILSRVIDHDYEVF
jgi:hypothetical protein